MSCLCHEVSHTEWWPVICMRLDVLDYLSGDLTQKQFTEMMLSDLYKVRKLIEDIIPPDYKREEIKGYWPLPTLMVTE